MPLFQRSQRLKTTLWVLVVVVAATLGFSVWRAKRLLRHSRQIAARSAGFARDYYLGNGPDLTYLAMGDSTAAGWGAADFPATYPHQIASALAARGFRVHVVNVAMGGATLSQVRREQSRFLLEVKPDLVTLGVGANDATQGTSPVDFGREMRLLQADLTASSARAILVANVPDMFLAPALPYPMAIVCGRRARALNAVFNSSLAPSRVQIIDIFGRGKLDYRRDASLYAADLFHPSGRGYAVWARLFSERIGKAHEFAARKSRQPSLTKSRRN